MSEETVFINGLEIPKQTINEITSDKTGSILKNAYFDGVVGLSFKALSEKNDTPILDNIQE